MCFFSPQYTFTLFHTGGVTVEPVIVSFDPTTYTVTEGVDGVANLMLVRSGGLTRTVVVTVTTVAGTATGMTHHCTTVTTHVHELCCIACTKSFLHNVGWCVFVVHLCVAVI